MSTNVQDPTHMSAPSTIARDDPRHPMYGLVNRSMTLDQMNEQRAANTARLRQVRTITPAKAEAMAKQFDVLQQQVIDTYNKATILLHQNQQLHQVVTVSRDIMMVAEKIARDGHLSEESAQELVQALQFLPPLAIIDQMILVFNN